MAAKKAVRYLTVGETTYAPGDEVPSDVVALVDNPDAWMDPEEESSQDEGEAPAAKKAAKKPSK